MALRSEVDTVLLVRGVRAVTVRDVWLRCRFASCCGVSWIPGGAAGSSARLSAGTRVCADARKRLRLGARLETLPLPAPPAAPVPPAPPLSTAAMNIPPAAPAPAAEEPPAAAPRIMRGSSTGTGMGPQRPQRRGGRATRAWTARRRRRRRLTRSRQRARAALRRPRSPRARTSRPRPFGAAPQLGVRRGARPGGQARARVGGLRVGLSGSGSRGVLELRRGGGRGWGGRSGRLGLRSEMCPSVSDLSEHLCD